MKSSDLQKHQNYEILNLIGYGLSKFNDDFIKEFGFQTKTAFYNYCVAHKIAETTGTIKNRMDLFDPFFPHNGRKGWWQKGDAYIHRKNLIDNLFGNENVHEFANIIKLYFKQNFNISNTLINTQPILTSKFKKLQETGLEAEIYFMNNYKQIPFFELGILTDARLYGDGYDFQISVQNNYYLTEVKGIREKKGVFRLTQNEYNKAQEYENQYVIAVILNMNDTPKLITIKNPTKNLNFKKTTIYPKATQEYQLTDVIC